MFKFLAWVVILTVVVVAFNAEKLPTWKKNISDFIEKQKDKKK